MADFVIESGERFASHFLATLADRGEAGDLVVATLDEAVQRQAVSVAKLLQGCSEVCPCCGSKCDKCGEHLS